MEDRLLKIGLISGVALLLAGCLTPSGEPRVITVQPASTGGQALSSSISGLLQQTRQSYVTLVVSKSTNRRRNRLNELEESVTSGSGFVIDPEGHVLTAAHVAVQPGWLVEARGPDGKNYVGRVVAVQKSSDSALVKLRDMASNARPVQPVAQPCLRRGEPIFSLGKPRRTSDTARLGEVASMSFGRPVTYKGFGYSDAMVLKLETRKGESGGPVFTSSGRLAGMVVSTLSDGTGRHLNLAHAVTAPMLAQFVCANTQCSTKWQAIAKINTSSCPAS